MLNRPPFCCSKRPSTGSLGTLKVSKEPIVKIPKTEIFEDAKDTQLAQTVSDVKGDGVKDSVHDLNKFSFVYF